MNYYFQFLGEKITASIKTHTFLTPTVPHQSWWLTSNTLRENHSLKEATCKLRVQTSAGLLKSESLVFNLGLLPYKPI